MKNEDLKENKDDLKEYEVVINEKKGFWTKFIEKIKVLNKQNLLPAGKDKSNKTVGRLSSKWEVRRFKVLLFGKLDNIHNLLFKKKESELKNCLKVDYVSEEDKNVDLINKEADAELKSIVKNETDAETISIAVDKLKKVSVIVPKTIENKEK